MKVLAVTLLVLCIEVKGSWVDPDSMVDGTKSLVDGRIFDLVFSDEFNIPGRRFDDGFDPRWTALHKNDYTNTALQFYDKNNVKTDNGSMLITTTAETTEFLALDDSTLKYRKTIKNFKSGMVQTWNKFCFTGGIIEVRAKLPGNALIGGLWPAIWCMGNLARATYVASSNWVWPWSYDTCDRTLQPKQLISACNPHPHYGMNEFTGRGAPEIDLLEAMPGHQKLIPSPVGKPYFSSSLQMSPGVETNRPGNGGPPWPGQWYEGLEYGKNSSQNIFFYGSRNVKKNDKYSYQSDAISGNTQLDKHLWGDFRVFRLEWSLPQSDDKVRAGYVRFFFEGEMIYSINGKSLADKVKGSKIPSEPQYVLLNTAMSSSWGFPHPCPPGCSCDCFSCSEPEGRWGKCGCAMAEGFCYTLPAVFMLDYVRVFQFAGDQFQKVGCSTPERPSKKWIEGHLNDYKDDWDETPLRRIQRGGGRCDSSSDCGHSGSSKRGSCHPSRRECTCSTGWTGPNCLAHDGFDPVDWEAIAERRLGFEFLWMPSSFLTVAVSLVSAVAAVTFLHFLKKREDRIGDDIRRLSLSSLNIRRAASGESISLMASSNRKSYSLLTSKSEVQLSTIPMRD